MLVECAIADASSIAYEFVPDTADRPNDLARYYQHPTYGDMVPGHYTDDTQRSIANARVILRGGDDLYNPLAYIAAYQGAFARDPRAGYSRRFESFLKENLDTEPATMALKINRKSTNGAIMGSAVFGFLPTIEQVKLASAVQALSTHSYSTIPYAQIVALSAHYMIQNIGTTADLCGWLYKNLYESSKEVADFLGDAAFRTQPPKKVSMEAHSAVKLMLWALPRNNSLSALVKLSVAVGGDTDSAAAIMVSVASESREYSNDLPENLIQGLENGVFGRDYLAGLDERLRNHTRG